MVVCTGTMTSADSSLAQAREASQGKTHVFPTYARRIYVPSFRVSIGLWQ